MTIASSGVFGCDLRPPTPPRDHTSDIDDALEFLKVDYSLDKPSSTFICDTSGIETPPKSSPSSTTNPSSRPSKRVEFKAYTLQHEGPSPKKETAPLRPLPQIREAKPLRSILKLGYCFTPTPEESSSPAPGYFSPKEPVSIPKMLASVLQSLASQDALLRLDGYMTLNNALKAHEEFPVEVELKEKVPRLMQYAIRDLKSEATSPQSKNITAQALNLVNVLFSKPNLTAEVSSEVRTTLLDLALQTFGQEPVNKAIANRFLYLLATPEFRARGLNQQKADMLITQLRDIHQRISGNSVVAARLAVYQRLIIQIPQIMLQRMADWVEHVFHGCLSNNEEICKRAIQCGMEAGLVLGTHFSATKHIVDLFASETDNGGCFGDYFVARLTDMTANKTYGVYAPQVWSVVIMFFRNKRSPISQWRVLKSLLLVVQRCLNSSDQQTKYQALIAWNRLTFVTGLGHASIDPPDRLLGMLKIPFTAALDVKAAADKGGPASRKTTLAGYANLLYYAFQPSQSFERIDFFWDFYLKDLAPKMLKYGGMDGRFANRILKAFFNGPSRAWSLDRALLPEPVDPDELVRLDAQWLRSRTPKVLATLESHFGASLCIPLEQSTAYQSSWLSLVTGIAEAGAQEVRPSLETREALAHLMNFFAKLWTTSHRWIKGNSPDAFITRFGDMVLSTVDAFGPLSFLQDNLAIDQLEKAGPAPTPANRASKHHNSLQSPFLFLWRLLATPTDTLDDSALIAQTANTILYKVFEGQTSSMSRLALLRQCATSLSSTSGDPSVETLHMDMMDLVLVVTSNVLKSHGDMSDVQIRLSQLARVSLAILKTSLALCTTDEVSPIWISAFDSLFAHLNRVAGSIAANLALLEPLAEALKLGTFSVSAGAKAQLSALLLERWTWMTSRQQFDRAWKSLEHTTIDAARRQTLLDKSPDVLYLADALCKDFGLNKDLCVERTPLIIDALHSCLRSCPLDNLLRTLHQLPNMLVLAQDRDRLIPRGSSLKELWSTILASTKALPHDSIILSRLESVFIAGFASSHSSIVNETIACWNTTFGQSVGLSYSDRLASVLQRVKDHVDLDLPTFPTEVRHTDEDGIRLPVFEGGVEPLSQDEEDTHCDTPRRLPLGSANAFESLHRRTPSRPKAAAAINRTPKSAAMPPPKLRHDNSQIEFVNVQNLPSELTDDGTQGLTDHQKEVRERQQQETTRMFPQFSSSPLPPSASKDIIRDRIAIVKAQDANGGRLHTPEIDADEHGPMDAFLGSSPSQRSAQRAQSRSSQLHSEPVAEANDDLEEVPSSPPELAEDFQTAQDEEPMFADVVITTPHVEEQESQIPATQQEPGLDLTSDEPMPLTAQAEVMEESAAVGPQTTSDLVKSDEFIEAPTEVFEARISHVQEDSASETSQPAAEIQSSIKTEDEDVEVDATRIEDSFAGTSDAGTTLVEADDIEQSTTDNQSSTITSGRRRKRAAASEQALPQGKRQKKDSPIKKLFSWLGGHKEDPRQGIDMEDCIVVASQPVPQTPAPLELDSRSASQPATTDLPAKRGRGRPRKSTRLSASQEEARPLARSLKRKSSMMSTNSVDDLAGSSIVSSIASSPRKTRRITQLQSRLEQAKLSPGNPSQHSEVSVVISPRPTAGYELGPEPIMRPNNTPDQTHVEEEDLITPERQLREEAAAAARAREERVILTPKSIIGRLRNILVDVKEMGKKFVLGSPEERELNGMLFELGGEIHAAGRRND
ncbi:Rap1-interacting factor 1-like protein [Elsinoe fawcettii]|nr:Rap1-interacting factor 1-like protein [Elsinoe fawcettii]